MIGSYFQIKTLAGNPGSNCAGGNYPVTLNDIINGSNSWIHFFVNYFCNYCFFIYENFIFNFFLTNNIIVQSNTKFIKINVILVQTSSLTLMVPELDNSLKLKAFKFEPR